MSAVMTTWQSQRTYLCNCDWDLSTNDAGMYGRSHVHSPRKAMNQLLTCPVPTPLCGTADGVVPGAFATHTCSHTPFSKQGVCDDDHVNQQSGDNH